MPKENETRMIVIAPSSSVTPDQITRLIHTLNAEVTVKETCYGAMIEGERGEVARTLEAVRKLDPNRIFTKVRGFPIGDARRCRAHHGSRPGFTQLEKEWECLTLIEKAVASAEMGESVHEAPRRKRITIEELKRIVEETE